ncbi:SDR family NAD(P)-dependent oxidoreductase [Cohnella herbarum]|uniref:SDR family NAD(P)-dependent oxidoreductase n=1 Tax=Cohnella herbarum TaxID=2728023 RepID=A0A7Z2VMG9_9BACL|nr:SDR family NAD(P)-dependent oxidoreductase [Cohnella herbarum]QJD86036.1 SDR family NAD(P)-dependent oxidoreductase [Cohnella herbarum]
MSKQLLVIVGAGPGVSAAVARKFGSEGFRIALIARNQASLDALSKELRDRDIDTYSVTADASKTESIQEAFKDIREQYGVPDALLYNAAAISASKVTQLDEQRLIDDFKVSVVGALTSVKQVAADFAERKEGTILITGGGLALHPNPDYASLSIGKAGVRSLAYSLAQELKPHNVYVGTVTIGGYVSKGTFFDPDRIAEEYWNLYLKRDEVEFVFAES